MVITSDSAYRKWPFQYSFNRTFGISNSCQNIHFHLQNNSMCIDAGRLLSFFIKDSLCVKLQCTR